MAGVEPASEEKTIETTPYIACLSKLTFPQPTDRVTGEATSSVLALARFAVHP
jgi:hypothetical protein